MQVRFNPLSSVKIEGQVLLSADEVNPFFDRALNKYEKSVHLDGFRKGHIPKDTLLKFYGNQIGLDAADEITRKYVGEVVKQLEEQKIVDLIMIQPPECRLLSQYPSRNKEWAFSLVFDNYPNVEKKDLSDLHVDVYDIKVDDSDLEATINRLCEMRSKYEVIDDLVVSKDKQQSVNINFVGKRDGVPFEGGTAEKFDLNVDNANMIDGFVEGIVGHKAGDEFTLNLVFPDDYHEESLRSVPVTFDIKVNTVSKRIVPEFDEELAKSFGFDPDKGTLDVFKKTLQRNIETQAEYAKLELNTSNMLNAILTKYPELEAPEVLIDFEANQCLEDSLKSYGVKDIQENIKKSLLTQYRENCKPIVLRQCLSRALAKAYDFGDSLSVSTEEVDAELEALACVYEEGCVDLEKFKKDAKEDQEAMALCRHNVYSRKLEQALMNLIKHDVKEMSFEEFGKLTSERDRVAKKEEADKATDQSADSN